MPIMGHTLFCFVLFFPTRQRGGGHAGRPPPSQRLLPAGSSRPAPRPAGADAANALAGPRPGPRPAPRTATASPQTHPGRHGARGPPGPDSRSVPAPPPARPPARPGPVPCGRRVGAGSPGGLAPRARGQALRRLSPELRGRQGRCQWPPPWAVQGPLPGTLGSASRGDSGGTSGRRGCRRAEGRGGHRDQRSPSGQSGLTRRRPRAPWRRAARAAARPAPNRKLSLLWILSKVPQLRPGRRGRQPTTCLLRSEPGSVLQLSRAFLNIHPTRSAE